MKKLKDLYNWVLKWADHKYSEPALAGVAFMEASFFPIPPDILLLAMGARTPKKSLRFALNCTIFSVLGAVLGYYIGVLFWINLQDFFFQYVFSESKFQIVSEAFKGNAFVTIFLAGFTLIPFKIFTVAAGVASISLPEMVAASVVARSMRYFLLAGILYRWGDRGVQFIEKHFEKSILIGGVLAIAALYSLKYFTHMIFG